MKRKYQKALKKINKWSLIKISLSIILFILSINIKEMPALIPIILVFFYIFFLIEFFASRHVCKEIYNYLSGNKTFKYKTVTVSRSKFQELIKEGIPANTYISYNKSIHTIETKNNKYFFLDFDEYKSYNEFLETEIANIKIKNIEKITFISYSGKAPKDFLK
jgi:hypothetical protein